MMLRTLERMQRAARGVWVTLIAAAMIAAGPVAPVADSAAAAETIDLSHLVPTATDGLVAHFVSPDANAASPVEATEVTVATIPGAVVDLSVNGESIDAKHLGKLVIDRKTNVATFFYYGVPLKAGPNTLTATPIGANGSAGTPVDETVYGPDEAVSVRADVVQHLIADGVTVVPINVIASDRFGHAAMPSERVRIAILSGDVHFVDLPQATPAPRPGGIATPAPVDSPDSRADRVLEVPLPVGGYLPVRVQPGTVAGNIELEFRVGKAYLRRSFYLEPLVRKPFVNGLVEAGAGSVPEAIDGDGNYDGGGARRGRVALYANGAVGRSLLTVAYESQNRLSPVSSFGAAAEDPNARPYLTYGDSSQVITPYHSSDHLFARLDRDRSSISWGEFTAKAGPADIGSYSQQLSGANGTLSLGRSGNVAVSGFTARNDQAFVSTLAPISGLASLTQTLQPNIVVGSEQLSVITLDRKTGLEVSEAALLRNVDYTIDYATGVLRFINIPLPYDANFNPNVLSLRYQYFGPGVRSRTTGGQVDATVSRDGHSKLLASLVNDAGGGANLAIAGQSFARTWQGGSLTVSHATSAGSLPSAGTTLQAGGTPLPGAGSALALAFDQRTAQDAIDLGYRATSAGYNDPFGGFSSPGVAAYRAQWTRGTQVTGQTMVSYSGEHNTGLGAASIENDLEVHHVRPIGRAFTASLGLLHHDQHVAASATPAPAGAAALATTGQTQVEADLTYRSTHRIGASLSELLTIGGSDEGSTQPSQTTLEASYEMPKRGRFFVRELWSNAPSATFANSTSNLGIAGASTHSMQIGVEDAVSPATTVSSQYVVNQTGSGLNVYDALGVDEHFRVSQRLSATAQVQAANALGNGAQGFTVGTTQFSYAAPANALRATLGYQMRTGDGAGSTLNLGLAGHISPNLGAMAFVQRAYGNGIDAINDRVSLAYRPLGDDHLISLFGYTRTNGGSLSGSTPDVLSFEELYRPAERTEIAGRFAMMDDAALGTPVKSLLYAVRVRQDIGHRSDIGAEMRTVSVPSATGARTTSFALEAGRTLGASTRVAIGYNVAGSVDPTLLGQPGRKGLYFTVTSILSSVFGWGKH